MRTLKLIQVQFGREQPLFIIRTLHDLVALWAKIGRATPQISAIFNSREVRMSVTLLGPGQFLASWMFLNTLALKAFVL